ncbi:MAG: hypothetical protein ABJG68_00715 [Crocinitomicaceae bacterium]
MKRILICFIGAILLLSCTKDNTPEPFVPEPCSDTISYNEEIVPQIIDLSCNVAGCHDATAAGSRELTSHSLVSENTDPLYRAMAHQEGYIPMPFEGEQIADSLLQKFYCWIQQGRLDN